MAVPTLITDLSTTISSNSPSGSEAVFPNLDDYLRSTAAFIASIRDNTGNGWVSPYLTTTTTAAYLTAPGPIGATTPNSIKGTTGTFTGAVSGTTGTFTGAVAGTTGTFSGAVSGTTGTFTGNVTLPSINGGQLAGLRNRIQNGGFSINQRGVSGTVTLSAGAYGHDRWKAGASGCTYTFATTANVTTLTISAGSLQQVVEGLNLETGTYCLSWTGTATGKIGAGSLSASGVTGSITGGTNTTIEFSTGTLSKVQLEIGSATPFEQRPVGLELTLCQRYFQSVGGVSGAPWASGQINGTSGSAAYVSHPVTFRASPTLAVVGTGFNSQDNSAGPSVATISLGTSSPVGSYLTYTHTALTQNASRALVFSNATSFLQFSADL